ncbi:MAG: acyl-CoA dehydrogenase family protein [Hyphomicrobiaceae bacterium]
MDTTFDSKPATQFPDAKARALTVAGLLRASTKRIEADRELPSHVLAALHEARLFRMLLPRSLGGDELDPPTLAEVTAIISAADASTAWCIGQGSGCSMSAAFMDAPAARQVFGPADAVLAWGAGAAGRAIATKTGYRVSGQWGFASGSRHATWLGAHCKVFEADGKPRLRPDGRHAERTALFPRTTATIHDVWQVMGLKGTGSDSYEVTDIDVPTELTLDRDNQAECREAGPLFRIPTTMAYSAAFSGVMLGIARGALDDMAALAMAKTPRGATSSMRESAVLQSDLARLEARWRALRALQQMTLRQVWDGVSRGGELTLQNRIDWRLATTHAINDGVQIVMEVYRAAGQTAIFEENPFEQRLRDALSASQQVQGRTTHYMTVGRHLLGLAPDTMMFI